MTVPMQSFDRLDWPSIASQLDIEGYALLPGLLSREKAQGLIARLGTDASGLRREPLASSGLGCGDLFYFEDPLPVPLPAWRSGFYRHLAPIANRWNETLDMPYRYPAELDEFLQRCREAGQARALSHLSRLGMADYLALHQRKEGAHVFPLQIVVLLAEPSSNFEGGEFVMTEQRQRMQSRPMVLPLRLGDAAIISTAHRPFKGGKGYYRVNLKHAISRVRRGVRVGLELSFHDGP